MKIIHRGTIPESKTYEFTCNHCGTVFECTRAESQHISDQREGDALRNNCPVCTRACYVAAK